MEQNNANSENKIAGAIYHNEKLRNLTPDQGGSGSLSSTSPSTVPS